ncbi:diguanylate cyclase [Methylomonas montana]|uniref:diguanylate cyclase n=1 Tax=Methylomonas montana TaxID=3058963 RepID=UPI002658F54F|nr:diguanylate cyclase [Methylomonas montana]WKJ90974.1 diguanylate cyclase [Methylomonas montana]
MFRTQLHSVWLSLNLALLMASFVALAVGAFWIIDDSRSEQQQQARQIQHLVSQALDLSKGNPKSLQPLLTVLPGSPMFMTLEIQGKSGRLLEIRYNTPDSGWLNTLPVASPIPLEQPLDTKGTLILRLLPAPNFALLRLIAASPTALITLALTFLVFNLTLWIFKKRFSFDHIADHRWHQALAADQPKHDADIPAAIATGDMLDCLIDAILRCDAQGRVRYMNTAARELLKSRTSKIDQANILDLIAPWDRTRCAELLLKTDLPDEGEQLETQAVGTNRGILPVTIAFRPAPAANGERVLVIHDARSERGQQEMLRLYALLLDAIPQGLAVLSPQDNGELLYANPAFRTLLNIGDTHAGKDTWFDRLASQLPVTLTGQIRSAIGRLSETTIELPWRTPNGDSRSLELGLFPANNGESRLVCVIRDQSEELIHRHRIEQEMSIRQTILDKMPIGFCITDDQAKIRIANASFAQLTGKNPQQLIGTYLATWVADRPHIHSHVYQGEHTIQNAHQVRFATLNTLPLTPREGNQEYAYFFEDITAFKQQAQANETDLTRLQQTLDSIANGIITTNEHGFIQYLNPYAQKLTGMMEHQYKGMAFEQAVHLVDEKKREPLVDPAVRAMRIGKIIKFRQDVLFIKENKQELAVEVSATPVFDRDNSVIGAVIAMKDVAEQRSLNRQMQLRASRDPLTGLINRRELLSMLEGLQYEVEEQSQQHTLCYMDLDKFKVVNDSCGHNAGDELLRQVSLLMNECLRASDVLARIGGDEFCAVFCNASCENSVIVAEKIREAVKRFRFTWNDKFFEIGVSIGLFELQPGLSIEETISAADQACYHAKEAGRDQVHIASASERDGGKLALTPWRQRLAEALDHDYFRLFQLDAQALADKQSKLPVYRDVLLQLHEPNQAPLNASAFMPNAYRLNLGSSIERWAIDKLFSIISARALNDASPEIFAIQVSAVTLTDNSFATFLTEQSKRHRVSARCICFEIAEDDLVQNFSLVQHFMQEGKKTGYHFCLSRFGGGVSSFAYLRNLPLDFIKIDSSLTQRLASDPIDAVIVRAIQAISEHMQIRIISYYTADAAMREFQGKLGIDYTQGSQAESTPLGL